MAVSEIRRNFALAFEGHAPWKPPKSDTERITIDRDSTRALPETRGGALVTIQDTNKRKLTSEVRLSGARGHTKAGGAPGKQSFYFRLPAFFNKKKKETR